ncbi:MAG: hypothetical protein M1819_003763 [Sarea resinae]|nr:MAG: hypothetical protein M1819_003763 [Sarea resinae]
MSGEDIAPVRETVKELRQLLQKARDLKPLNSIEPPLSSSDFGGSVEQVCSVRDDQSQGQSEKEPGRQSQFAIIETAARNIFYDLLASTSIEDPSFTELWNLLDIVSIFSDNEQCEPGLIFWLIEELLDSQTIEGCRRIFDYLESRRERITAKHFKQKNLIILRSCNELLRRLSRAEDTVFCGRVFIFLFQSFPLGDKSSVNLRGEYHVENITTFDEIQPKSEPEPEIMEVDGDTKDSAPTESVDTTAQKEAAAQGSRTPDASKKPTKTVTFDANKVAAEELPDMDSLYTTFWTLQQDFSSPTKLFEPERFEAFKAGLRLVIRKFETVQKGSVDRSVPKVSTDDSKRGIKRKRDDDDGLASNFNPKYLTSRDLFDLEISDLAFRRHILVQALILVDFLLSLTQKAKSKMADLNQQNKSVIYGHTLSDEDAKWALQTRSAIASYLQEGPEGKFYYRMVDTVLSRDKNWVRWKAENCPPIERPPFSTAQYLSAQKGIQDTCTNKRLRATPLGSLNLNFLSDAENMHAGLDRLKDPEKHKLPLAESFQGPIMDNDFDIDMAGDDEAKKTELEEQKASKLWRALRIASKNKLKLFDKIDDGRKLEVLFRKEEELDERARSEGTRGEGGTPDTRGVVGTPATGKGKTDDYGNATADVDAVPLGGAAGVAVGGGGDGGGEEGTVK